MPDNTSYNKRLQPNAHKLRNEMTKAESCLWKYVLSKGMMIGFTFRRQRPVLTYIADFMCKELMLIIEVDGITHTYEEIRLKDDIRQSDLEKAGFTVLRYTDDEVLYHINAVKESIEHEVKRIMEAKLINAPSRRRKER